MCYGSSPYDARAHPRAGIPRRAAALLACAITADGKALDSNLPVITVDVWSAVNAVPKAKVVLQGGGPPDEPFSKGDFEALRPGRTIEIHAGYGGTTDTIFSGIVVAQGIEVTGDGPPRVVVDASGDTVAASQTMTAEPAFVAKYGESILTFEAALDQQMSRHSGIRGQVTFQGSALARPGSLIDIAGVGGPFDGRVLVRAVHHDIGQGQWKTRAEFGTARQARQNPPRWLPPRRQLRPSRSRAFSAAS